MAAAANLYACPMCGCTDVHETAWVYVNTGENTGDDGPSGDYFCPECDERGFGEIYELQQTTNKPQPRGAITERTWTIRFKKNGGELI